MPQSSSWATRDKRRIVVLDEFHLAESSAAYTVAAAAAKWSGTTVLVLTATATRIAAYLQADVIRVGDAEAKTRFESEWIRVIFQYLPEKIMACLDQPLRKSAVRFPQVIIVSINSMDMSGP